MGVLVTLQEMHDCALRELRRRERAYPVRIANRRMSRREAVREFVVMRAICEEFAQRLADRETLREIP